MIADLVCMQRAEPYTPIDPHSMSYDAQPPHVEQGRLETRLANMYKQLKGHV